MKKIMEDTVALIKKSESEELKLCRQKIVEMVGYIEDEKFLKRIYISLREYINQS